jgi:ribonuclease HI
VMVRVLQGGHATAQEEGEESAQADGAEGGNGPEARAAPASDEQYSSTQTGNALPLRWHQYTDGAWTPPDEDSKGAAPEAGYGVAEFTLSADGRACDEEGASYPLGQICHNTPATPSEGLRGRVSWAVSGTVPVDEKEADHIGATVHTNNTGELSAMYYALERACRRRRGSGREVIWSDSLYTIHMTTGTWLPRRKRTLDMIHRLNRIWRQLRRRRPGEVRLRHVRSHVMVPGNELADWLADGGANGAQDNARSARAWLDGWLAKHVAHPPPAETGPGTRGDRVGVG